MARNVVNTLANLLRNIGFSIMADLINRIANTLLFVGISRTLGVSAAGTFSLAISYFFIGSRFSFWGLGHLLTRDVARQRDQAERYFTNFVVLRFVLSVMAVAAIAVIARGLPYGQQTRTIILIISLGILPENISDICQALFMAFERMHYLSVVALLGGTVKLALSLLLLKAGGEIELLAVAFTIANGLRMLISLFLATTRLVRLHWHLDCPFCRKQLCMALPFIFVGMFFILDNRTDVILLSIIKDEETVGFYSAAATIVTALSMIPQGIRTAIYPVLARYQSTSSGTIPNLYVRLFKYLFLLALPMALGTMLIADESVCLIYEASFAPSIPVLRVLIWYVLLYSLSILHSRLLIVNNRQDLVAKYLLTSLSINVVLNVLLVPIASAVGAAIAKVVAASTLFLLSGRAARRIIGISFPWQLLPRPLTAGGIMAASVLLLRPWGLVAQIPVAAIIYCGTLIALRTFSPEEQALWQQALAQKIGFRVN